MKKILLLIISFLILSSICFADGDTNVDSGGSSLGSGTSVNQWINGDEGVRVTAYNKNTLEQVGASVDYSNANPNDIVLHFGKNSKQYYKLGYPLIPDMTNSYTCTQPTVPLPDNIIYSNDGGQVSKEELAAYFCSEGFLMQHCSLTNMDYETLINGDYKLIVEPIAYVTYYGIRYAFTATEAALLNASKPTKMPSITHKNLPLSMFLESSDLGYPKWTGTTSSQVTDSQICTYLGIGIVSFDSPEIPLYDDGDYDYEYRTDTEVIASVYVTADKWEIDPDDEAYVEFDVLGTTIRKYFVAPKSGRQLVWVRFNTPSEPQQIDIIVTTTDGSLDTNIIKCNIVKLEENTPPDPTSYDTNSSFAYSEAPIKSSNLTNSWYEWWAWWHEHWVWDSGLRMWVDKGWWVFEKNEYTATLISKCELSPSESVPTATTRGYDPEIKSGYGVEIVVNPLIQYNCSSYDATDIGNAITFFSEFDYQTYNRLLEKVNNEFVFKFNEYSFTGENNHYTPLWYPDDTKYEVMSIAFDMWTPAGQLWAYDSDYVWILGNVYDDYDMVEVSPNDPDFPK